MTQLKQFTKPYQSVDKLPSFSKIDLISYLGHFRFMCPWVWLFRNTFLRCNKKKQERP